MKSSAAPSASSSADTVTVARVAPSPQPTAANTVRLRLSRNLFQVTVTGEKKSDFRGADGYRTHKLLDDAGRQREDIAYVEFFCGYDENAPRFLAKLSGMTRKDNFDTSYSNGARVCAGVGEFFLVLMLGDIIERDNCGEFGFPPVASSGGAAEQPANSSERVGSGRMGGAGAVGEESLAAEVFSEPGLKRAKLSAIDVGGYIISLEPADMLGRGSFGEVRRGWKKSAPGEKLAIKRVSQSADTGREIGLLRGLDHPNVVKLLDSFSFRSNTGEQFDALVMSLAESTLKQRLPALGGKPYEKFLCVLQLTTAIQWLHAKSVMHRDLKPSNILCQSIESGWRSAFLYKLADFGLGKATRADSGAKNQITCGTPQYMAPEVLQGRPYTSKADVYSLGVVVCEVISVAAPGTEGFQKVWETQELECLHADRVVPAFWGEVFSDYDPGEEHPFGSSLDMDQLIGRVVAEAPPIILYSLLQLPKDRWNDSHSGCPNLAEYIWGLTNPRHRDTLRDSRADVVSVLFAHAPHIFSPRYLYDDICDEECAVDGRYGLLVHHKQLLLAERWLLEMVPIYMEEFYIEDEDDEDIEWWEKRISDFGKAFGALALEFLYEKLAKVHPFFAQHKKGLGF